MSKPFPPIIPTEDFWSRRENAQAHAFECAPYGVPTRITANRADALEAARLSARRYSRSETFEGKPIHIQVVVSREAGAPLPDDLPDRLKYTGVDEWILLSAGEWGHSFGNLRTRTALVALSQTLAADARLVSRYFVDHYVLNFALTEWAMLHASCVLDASRRRLIVMVATHDTGKSTTALRLTRAGFTFLADGIALLKVKNGNLVVGGYPIGEVKLRDDALGWFPEYSGQAIQVREHQKTIVDLRSAHPDRIVESLLTPEAIHLCFVERHDSPRTHIAPIGATEAAQIVSTNTVYWHTPEYLAHNSATLQHVLRTASLHRLRIGGDPDGIVAAFDRLAG